MGATGPEMQEIRTGRAWGAGLGQQDLTKAEKHNQLYVSGDCVLQERIQAGRKQEEGRWGGGNWGRRRADRCGPGKGL